MRTDATGLQDYSSRNAHLMGAAMMAYEAQKIRHTYPNSPIYLMGYCAGSCIVLNAAEQLPPATVDRIVLLAPSVSSHYDVRQALKASRLGIDVFFNSEDSILEFKEDSIGTSDGLRDSIAGRTGFLVGKNRNTALAADPILLNLRQFDIGSINGGHLAATRTTFLQTRIAPLVATGQRVPTAPPPAYDPGMRLPPAPPSPSIPQALPTPSFLPPPSDPPAQPNPAITKKAVVAPPALPALPEPAANKKTVVAPPAFPVLPEPTTKKKAIVAPPPPPPLPDPVANKKSAVAPFVLPPLPDVLPPSVQPAPSPVPPMLPPPPSPKKDPILPPPSI